MAGRVTGGDKVLKNLSKLESKLDDSIAGAIVATAGEIQGEAIRSINKQSPGKKITRNVPGLSKEHTVSRPGDAPNTDTGALVGSIKVRSFKPIKTAYVFSDKDYGFYLETVLNRPWLNPAMHEKKGNLKDNIKIQLTKDLA